MELHQYPGFVGQGRRCALRDAAADKHKEDGRGRAYPQGGEARFGHGGGPRPSHTPRLYGRQNVLVWTPRARASGKLARTRIPPGALRVFTSFLEAGFEPHRRPRSKTGPGSVGARSAADFARGRFRHEQRAKLRGHDRSVVTQSRERLARSGKSRVAVGAA